MLVLWLQQTLVRAVPGAQRFSSLLYPPHALTDAWNLQRKKTASGRVTHPCIHFRCYRWQRCQEVDLETAGVQSKLGSSPQIRCCGWLDSRGSICQPRARDPVLGQRLICCTGSLLFPAISHAVELLYTRSPQGDSQCKQRIFVDVFSHFHWYPVTNTKPL